MKIFGLEIKFPRTRKSIHKELLRDKGSLYLRRYMKEKYNWHVLHINNKIYNLIREGNFDLDLWRLFKIQGQLELIKKLLNTYELNPYQLRMYKAQIKKFDKKIGKNWKSCI